MIIINIIVFTDLFRDTLCAFSGETFKASSPTDSREATCFCGEALLIQRWRALQDRGGCVYFYLADRSIDFYSPTKADILSLSFQKR